MYHKTGIIDELCIWDFAIKCYWQDFKLAVSSTVWNLHLQFKWYAFNLTIIMRFAKPPN